MGTAVKNGEKYKKKVERVYVPPTVVNVYGTIRRTLGRSRGEAASSVDYVPAAAAENQRRRTRNQHRSSSNGERPVRSSSNPVRATSPPSSSRAARSRDRARQSGQRGQRRLAQDVFNQAAHNDQQQLLRNQSNQPNQGQPLPQSRVNKHQVIYSCISIFILIIIGTN